MDPFLHLNGRSWLAAQGMILEVLSLSLSHISSQILNLPDSVEPQIELWCEGNNMQSRFFIKLAQAPSTSWGNPNDLPRIYFLRDTFGSELLSPLSSHLLLFPSSYCTWPGCVSLLSSLIPQIPLTGDAGVADICCFACPTVPIFLVIVPWSALGSYLSPSGNRYRGYVVSYQARPVRSWLPELWIWSGVAAAGLKSDRLVRSPVLLAKPRSLICSISSNKSCFEVSHIPACEEKRKNIKLEVWNLEGVYITAIQIT